MKARIYKPAKTAMQSGKAQTKEWCFEYVGGNERFVDSVMGWTGTTDMKKTEVKLYFKSLEEAERYARNIGVEYEVQKPKESKPIIKAYSDNYKFRKHEEA